MKLFFYIFFTVLLALSSYSIGYDNGFYRYKTMPSFYSQQWLKSFVAQSFEFMDDAAKLIALESLLNDVIFSLEMTQYSIEDSHKAYKVVEQADDYFRQMLDIMDA